jgi:AcrR family transcriptional regulator
VTDLADLPANRTASPPSGLRERRRQALTAEIEAVALDLFAERGFAEVTVDDIANAAGISRRTFFRYYASKDDLLLAERLAWVDHLHKTVESRPPDEPVLTSLHHAMADLAEQCRGRRQIFARRQQILADDDALRARLAGQMLPWTDLLTDAVAKRLRLDPAHDVRPALLATAAGAAFHAALRTWVAGDEPTGEHDLPALLDDAFALLADGLGGIDTVPAGPPTAGRP